MGSARDPAADLRRIAFLLERNREPTFRVRAFRTAADVVDGLAGDELRRRDESGSLTELAGIGATTARCISESLAGDVPGYLAKLEQQRSGEDDLAPATAAFRAALRGDCHTHSDWSDGGSPIGEMADAARALGHDYLVLTDHSPRLKVANGLTAERLERQLDVVAELNERYADDGARPFRILTGIEVDILEDGTLDQKPSLLSRLDLVVASVHSKLRMPAAEMTPRMVAAVSNPHTDVLGHCTGRLVAPHHDASRRAGGPEKSTSGRGTRPESEFDAEMVFAACARFGVAVEINSRPERLDPPTRLLRIAVDSGCLFSIDTDAHAPGQLDWQPNGCERAARCDVPMESIVNTWTADDLLAWTADHSVRSG
ncbi:MAG TPA: PHP domain-containing protein [Jatrophihabitans sp.]|nr:PHP domain-containing protein [Jatrophihabitans sp.]